MKIVIACAGSKHGNYFQAVDGAKINFVAQPRKGQMEFRPDDPSDRQGKSWRDCLEDYNVSYIGSGDNPFGLSAAYELYSPKHPGNSIYQNLVNKFQAQNVFILSAGWGLIRSNYLLPRYDITFAAQADPYKKRNMADNYNDFGHLKPVDGEKIVLFAGQAYLQLFQKLTRSMPAHRIVFFHGKLPSARLINDCQPIPYPNGDNRTWYYACAKDFIAGHIKC
jgi:hypothetical protein